MHDGHPLRVRTAHAVPEPAGDEELVTTLGGGSAEFEQASRDLIEHLEGRYLSFETDTGPETVAP